MHFNKLDLNLLVTLNMLLRERSVTRAAEHLHLSPSSVSHALSRLRAYFNDELLMQVGRRLELTERAEELRKSVPQLFLHIESVVSQQAGFDPTKSQRTFRIYASDYTLAVLAPHLLRQARQRGFKGRIDFMPQRVSPARELDVGDADLIIVPQQFIATDHPSQILYEDRFVCIVWAESQLAEGRLTLDRYQHAEHAVMQTNIEEDESFDEAFISRFKVHRHVVASTYSFSALPALVVGTDLIATVQLRLALLARAASRISVKELPLAMEGMNMQQAMQWHAGRALDPALHWLRDVCVDATTAIKSGDACDPRLG